MSQRLLKCGNVKQKPLKTFIKPFTKFFIGLKWLNPTSCFLKSLETMIKSTEANLYVSNWWRRNTKDGLQMALATGGIICAMDTVTCSDTKFSTSMIITKKSKMAFSLKQISMQTKSSEKNTTYSNLKSSWDLKMNGFGLNKITKKLSQCCKKLIITDFSMQWETGNGSCFTKKLNDPTFRTKRNFMSEDLKKMSLMSWKFTVRKFIIFSIWPKT